MKKYLLSSSLAMAFAFCSAVYAMADNVVYGVATSLTGSNIASYDLDAVTNDSTLKVTKGLSIGDEITGLKCGTTVGNKYYAYLDLFDCTTYEESIAFATINFETGKVVKINNKSFKYPKPGYQICGLAYDKVNDVTYGIEKTFDEASDESVTKLYSVDITTGLLTTIASLPGEYDCIASDNNGGFYLYKYTLDAKWKAYPQLYKLNADYTVEQIVENADSSATMSSSVSMLTSKDGNSVYVFMGYKVYAFDLTTKTFALKGTLNGGLLGMTFDKSSADGEPADIPDDVVANKRLLVAQYTYQGIHSVDDGNVTLSLNKVSASDLVTDSNRKFYFYNTEGKLVGESDESRDYVGSKYKETFTPMGIVKYTYNEDGNCVKETPYQWGEYDFEDYSWKTGVNIVSHEYDAQGQLVADATSYNIHKYAYNEDGTLAADSTYSKFTGKLMSLTQYLQYDGKNPISYVVSDGPYDINLGGTYNYMGYISYDDNGNKVEEIQYKETANPDDPEMSTNTILKLETWEYEGNNLVANYIYDGDNEEPTEKILYLPIDGNNDDVLVLDSMCMNGIWYEQYSPKRLVYTDMTDMEDDTAIEFAAEAGAEPGTVDLMFSVPNKANLADCKFVIYRDCLPVDTVALWDVYDDKEGYCVYQDKNVRNGVYDYFVQPIFAQSSFDDGIGGLDLDEPGVGDDVDPGLGDIDDPWGDSGEATWTGYFCSNPVTVEVKTELPAVTNFHYDGATVKVTGSFTAKRTTYNGMFKWTNAKDADKYGFISNSLYVTSGEVAQAKAAEGADSASVTLYMKSGNSTEPAFNEGDKIYVVSRYALGYAMSDSIDIPSIDVLGVENVTVGSAVKATFSANTVTLSDNANVAVFAANGQQVYAEANTNVVSLANLPAATYIVVVEKNGKAEAYKYSVK